MPSQLHKDMVRTCELELGSDDVLTDDKLWSMRRKGHAHSPSVGLIPDLVIGKQLAVECIIVGLQHDLEYAKSFPNRLTELSSIYEKIILVFPIPNINNITEIWLYKPNSSLVKYIPTE